MATRRKRGFTKTAAEEIALEMRGELEIGVDHPLDDAALLEHLCLDVLMISDVRGADAAEMRYLMSGRGKGVFSAATIHLDGRRRAIIVNPSHPSTRKRNSVCHEVSHLLLEHAPEGPLSLEGARSWNGQQEEQADYLAGALLIPKDAAHAAALAGLTDDEVAARFRVSPALARMRMNTTGARLRARRLVELRRRW